MIERHASGRNPIGVAQQPYPCYDYPLMGPVPDPIKHLLADIKLVYDDPSILGTSSTPFQLPFRLVWLYGIGSEEVTDPEIPMRGDPPLPEHAVDCMIVDANNTVVFDTTTAEIFRNFAYGGRMHTYTWQKSRTILYLTVHTHWPEHEDIFPEAREYDDHIICDAKIDPRCVTAAPLNVRTLSVPGKAGVAGAFKFVAGNNMLLDEDTDLSSLRQQSQIVFSSIPGAGEGIFKGCGSESSAIHSVNKQVGDKNGRFFLQTDTCTWIRRPLVNIGGSPEIRRNTLQIGDDCKPCCDCIDYAKAAVEIYKQQRSYKAIGNAAAATKRRYMELLPLLQPHKFRIKLTAMAQFCPYVDVVLQVDNAWTEPTSVHVNLQIAGDPALDPTKNYLPGSTAWIFGRRGEGNEPEFWQNTVVHTVGTAGPNIFDYDFGYPWIHAGESAYYRFRLDFQDCDAREITLTATGTVEGMPILNPDGSESGAVVRTVEICGE